ncbi:Morn repeat incomplete domain containing protein [Pandoravirus quercus]|uniref:Morn repeat incomplete domain containing protein n=1 Tax=Pandoravirus quercus TaxID=2107709 RepID=A0A2U7U9Z7_9VIRU|nr:Morn repeat incomplete domain containing protein [Pandoravirus quercus]AVK75267.1 Morn repeat incomplete domain containing protein [Pandoravirus quercus]
MDRILLLDLPAEILWAIADSLLCGAADPSAVARLGLVNRALYSTLVDDDTSWLARCRRRYGRAQTDLFEKATDAGMRWIHIYAAMSRTYRMSSGWATARVDINGPATLIAHGAIYQGQTARGRPTGYGLYTTHTRNRTDGYLVVAEAHLSGDVGCQSGWIRARRINATGHATVPPPTRRVHRTNGICLCALCKDAVPTFAGPLGGTMIAYTGGWDAGRLHGQGHAEFDCGLVYEGQWAGGVPHGCGTLDGDFILQWHRGVPIESGRCTITDVYGGECYGGEWMYEGDVTLAASSGYEHTVRQWYAMLVNNGVHALRELDTSKRADAANGHMWLSVPDTMAHGRGTATHTDGRVYSGTWRLNRRQVGRCTLANGTVLDGAWGARPPGGSGTVTYDGHLTYAHVLWNARDQPCRHGRLRRPVLGAGQSPRACPCAPQYLTRYGGSHGGSDDYYVVHRNGDVCGGECRHDEDGALSAVRWFACSDMCVDPDFAGLMLFADGGWSRARPKGRPWTSAVYWPTNVNSDAFARFAAYVRKGLIGWDEDMINFFWQTMAGLHVDRADP